MNLGIVKGNAICSIKYPGTEGYKLMLVQPVNKHLQPTGALVVAADAVQAGIGDLCVMVRSREATLALSAGEVPIDLALVGIVDQLDVHPDDNFNLVIKKGWNPYT